MKFFIDTASVAEIQQAAELGLLDGVTTNPSLLSKEQGAPREILREIAKLVAGPVSAEGTATDSAGMLREARELRGIADNIVVKVPMTLDGLRALRVLSAENVPTNCTLVFNATQALMAAKAGATYVSPFVGRLDDISADGMQLIGQCCAIYRNYGLESQVLAASIRLPQQVTQAALLGAHAATIPPPVLRQLANHPLTDSGLAKFLADWEKIENRM